MTINSRRRDLRTRDARTLSFDGCVAKFITPNSSLCYCIPIWYALLCTPFTADTMRQVKPQNNHRGLLINMHVTLNRGAPHIAWYLRFPRPKKGRKLEDSEIVLSAVKSFFTMLSLASWTLRWHFLQATMSEFWHRLFVNLVSLWSPFLLFEYAFSLQNGFTDSVYTVEDTY